jgi:hypothetical protein
LHRCRCIAAFALAASCLAAIGGVSGYGISAGCSATGCRPTDRVAAFGDARGFSTASRGAIAARAATGIGIAAGCSGVSTNCRAAIAARTSGAGDGRRNRPSRGVAAFTTDRFGIGRTALAGRLFIFRSSAIIAGVNVPTDCDSVETGVTAVSTSATGTIAGIGRSARASVGSAGYTEPTSCLTSLATDVSAANGRSAGNRAADGRATRRGSAYGIATIRITAERNTAGAVAAGVRTAIDDRNSGAGPEISNRRRAAGVLAREAGISSNVPAIPATSAISDSASS